MITVVIGDHQRLVREVIAAHLRRQPGVAAVFEAGNAEQVLDLVCREHPDLVLIECEIPGRDPFETVPDIRRAHDRCRVLFMADHVYDDHVEAALACGANGYLLKHDPLAALDEAVRKVMTTGLFFSQPIQDRLAVTDGRLRLARPRTGQAACLTDRECELLRHLANGRSLRHAAEAMRISYKSADNLKSHLARKLNIHDRVELARFALREGLACPTEPRGRAFRRLDAPRLPGAL